MSHGHFLKTSIYVSCMSHIYVIDIFSDSEFCCKFYENKIFESAHAKFLKFLKIDFLRNAWAKTFLVFKFENNAKIHIK